MNKLYTLFQFPLTFNSFVSFLFFKHIFRIIIKHPSRLTYEGTSTSLGVVILCSRKSQAFSCLFHIDWWCHIHEPRGICSCFRKTSFLCHPYLSYHWKHNTYKICHKWKKMILLYSEDNVPASRELRGFSCLTSNCHQMSLEALWSFEKMNKLKFGASTSVAKTASF